MSDWIEWKGGECPVASNTKVVVQFRYGESSPELQAGLLCWEDNHSPVGIVAYRFVLQTPQDVVQNPSNLQPFAIVAIVSPVDDRRYSLAEEAKQEALRLSKEKGYTYTVVQVLGEARCHKSSEWVGG